MAFEKLVRFEHDGKVSYGDLIASNDDGFRVRKLDGDISKGFQSTGDAVIRVDKVIRPSACRPSHLAMSLTGIPTQLLCPIDRTPIIQCVGVNYKEHVTEAKVRPPASFIPKSPNKTHLV